MPNTVIVEKGYYMTPYHNYFDIFTVEHLDKKLESVFLEYAAPGDTMYGV